MTGSVPIAFGALSRYWSRGGLAVRVPSTLATKAPIRVRILGVAICSRVDSKRSESRDGYSSATKMPAMKSSRSFRPSATTRTEIFCTFFLRALCEPWRQEQRYKNVCGEIKLKLYFLLFVAMFVGNTNGLACSSGQCRSRTWLPQVKLIKRLGRRITTVRFGLPGGKLGSEAALCRRHINSHGRMLASNSGLLKLTYSSPRVASWRGGGHHVKHKVRTNCR